MFSGADILHLIDPGAARHEPGALADHDALDLVSTLARSLPDYRHRAITLGPGPAPAGARRVRSVAGILGAATALRVAGRAPTGRCIVHCYSRRAAFGARMAFGSRWPILLSTGEPRPVASRIDRLIRPPDETILHAVEPSPGALPLGTVDPVSDADRAALREALSIAPNECVVAALGEPGDATNARWLVFFAGILVAGGLDLTILVPRAARQVARMRRFHATTRLNLRVILVEEGADLALAASDVALARPDAHSRHVLPAQIARSIRRAHALGVPVIARREDAPASLYPSHAADNLLVPSLTTRRVAQSLTRLIESPALRTELRAAVRNAAFSPHHPALASATESVYRRLLSRAPSRVLPPPDLHLQP